jgi:mono/diheme cytochrome c family protein
MKKPEFRSQETGVRMTMRLIYLAASALMLAISAHAQNVADVVKQGEQVFAKSCATGYCHGVKGLQSGAPRLAARGFDQAYIGTVVSRGVPNTAMPPFATRLSGPDLTAVVAYVATLNGIANPSVGADATAATSLRPALSGEAARGAALFKETVRGFGRCSTCHAVGGFGIPVAAPIAKVPASIAALKALATPNIRTGTLDGEAMPVLVLAEGKQGTVFYDLTSAPPVQRTTEPGSVKITDGSSWRHASVISAYTDTELGAVLAYLRVVVKP